VSDHDMLEDRMEYGYALAEENSIGWADDEPDEEIFSCPNPGPLGCGICDACEDRGDSDYHRSQED
jgi:hypothetical protein